MCWFILFHPRPYWTTSTLPNRPGSALRHREVADYPEVADSVDARTCPQKTADIDSLRYSPDDPHYSFGPVHTCLYVRVTRDCWLLPLPISPATFEGGDWWADHWVLKRREFQGLARVNQVTTASLGYPLSVFNKNSSILMFLTPLAEVTTFKIKTLLSKQNFRTKNQKSKVACWLSRCCLGNHRSGGVLLPQGLWGTVHPHFSIREPYFPSKEPSYSRQRTVYSLEKEPSKSS